MSDDDDDDDVCIADDSTECDCTRCEADRLGWEHEQGQHYDEDTGDLVYEDGCPGCEFASERARSPSGEP